MWTRTNVKYFIDYLIKVKNKDTGEVIHECEYNAKGKRVMICFDSKAIGDTLAWFPYVEEFRKKHNCEVIVSIFKHIILKVIILIEHQFKRHLLIKI